MEGYLHSSIKGFTYSLTTKNYKSYLVNFKGIKMILSETVWVDMLWCDYLPLLV